MKITISGSAFAAVGPNSKIDIVLHILRRASSRTWGVDALTWYLKIPQRDIVAENSWNKERPSLYVFYISREIILGKKLLKLIPDITPSSGIMKPLISNHHQGQGGFVSAWEVSLETMYVLVQLSLIEHLLQSCYSALQRKSRKAGSRSSGCKGKREPMGFWMCFYLSHNPDATLERAVHCHPTGVGG